MKLGTKIKERRLTLGLKQKDVAGDRMTRSMLCEIENGTATPSLATLLYLADRLGVTPGYLLNEDQTEATNAAARLFPRLWELYRQQKYAECVKLAEEYPSAPTPDLAYLLTSAHLMAAEACAFGGSVNAAKEHLSKMQEYAALCIFDTEHLLCRAELCRALVSDPLTPHYSLKRDLYESLSAEGTNQELYHYLLGDTDYPYLTPTYRQHMTAKKQIREHRYLDAIQTLRSIIDNRTGDGISVLLIYRIYSDLETCYRERQDYENAYKCASKKNTLLASFRN